jgi:hypothetical protein
MSAIIQAQAKPGMPWYKGPRRHQEIPQSIILHH